MRINFLGLLFLARAPQRLAFTSSAFHAAKYSPIKKGCGPQIARYVASSSNDDEASLPTVEQASSDPFMKQISHASQIVSMMHDKETCDEEALASLLKAQLSHPDGIRGFFATYLTSDDEDAAADQEIVPQLLVEAVEAADAPVIVPFAFMNVIMPTAMSSLHTDPELQSSAALTANRGVRILSLLSGFQKELVEINRKASIKATSVIIDDEDNIDDERVQYWEKFYKKCGYGDKQKQDIAETMKALS